MNSMTNLRKELKNNIDNIQLTRCEELRNNIDVVKLTQGHSDLIKTSCSLNEFSKYLDREALNENPNSPSGIYGKTLLNELAEGIRAEIGEYP